MISFITANYVAREVGYAMHGWGHGDKATNEAFAPLETYPEKIDELLGDVAALGFAGVDVWGAHLSPDWATDAHVDAILAALQTHGLTVTSYATWVGPSNIERSCELARALGTDMIGIAREAEGSRPRSSGTASASASRTIRRRRPRRCWRRSSAAASSSARRSTPAGGGRRATTPRTRSRSSPTISSTST